MKIVLVVACVALVACGGSPAGPSPQESLRLTASITQSVIANGQVATLTFRLQNLGPNTATLNFSDSCQVMPYIANTSGVVYPPRGSWVCATVLTSLTLQPGESQTRDLKVAAGMTSLDSVAPLPSGDYSAYARVESTEAKLQSDSVRFTVQ